MVALITGASKGIGFKTAELFRTNGYKVIITGRNEQKLIDAAGILEQKSSQLSQQNLQRRMLYGKQNKPKSLNQLGSCTEKRCRT